MSPNTDKTQVAITGLTPEEAEARLARFGPNEAAATKHHSFLSDFLHAFTNPLALILVIAAVVSAFLGQTIDAGIIGRHCSVERGYRLRADLSFSTRRRTTARSSCPDGNRPTRRRMERNSAA